MHKLWQMSIKLMKLRQAQLSSKHLLHNLYNYQISLPNNAPATNNYTKATDNHTKQVSAKTDTQEYKLDKLLSSINVEVHSKGGKLPKSQKIQVIEF